MWKKKDSKICQEMREKGHKALPRNDKKGTDSKISQEARLHGYDSIDDEIRH
jgi:hypothetical protein